MSIISRQSPDQTQTSELLHVTQSSANYQPRFGYDLGKRLLETIIALVVLLLFAPLWLTVAVVIKLTSPGPVLYKGRVVGRYGREFTYYKFRSMAHNNDNSQHRTFIEHYVRQHLKVEPEPLELATFDDNRTVKLRPEKVNASADSGEIAAFADNTTVKLRLDRVDSNALVVPGNAENPALYVQKAQLHSHNESQPQFKLTNDSRVTSIGRIIRKLSIDEVPQMWNVIRGEMAIVGPRPPVPYEFSLYDEACKQRLLVRPGITGLAQVKARGQVTFQQMVGLDFAYIEQRSLALDISIMLRTPAAMLKGA